jgi:oligopeptidase B
LAPAADGEQIPILVLHAKGLKLDGRAPLLLQGYGAYGTATDAAFDTEVLSLVKRGFVYAIAQVRGGVSAGDKIPH